HAEVLNQGMLNGERQKLHVILTGLFEEVGALASSVYHASLLRGTSRRNRALGALSEAQKKIKAGADPGSGMGELAIETGVPLSVPVPTAADLLDHPPTEQSCLMEPAFIMDSGITVLAAPTKVGKTNFWLAMARLLTTGGEWANLFGALEPMPV